MIEDILGDFASSLAGLSNTELSASLAAATFCFTAVVLTSLLHNRHWADDQSEAPRERDEAA